MKLRTPRLELIPATVEIITADLHGRERLVRLLHASPGPGWPPPLLDVRAMEHLKRSLQSDPKPAGWTAWYWILRRSRTVVGLSGFKSRPVGGRVEIGYTLLPLFQRRGLATEAVRAMVRWAFANGVELVFAETLPELLASQRVLSKCGFHLVGEGSEPGVIRFERKRSCTAKEKRDSIESRSRASSVL